MKSQKTILFLSFSGIYPSRDGKRQRTKALIDLLSQEFKIEFLIIGDHSEYLSSKLAFEQANLNFHFIPVQPDIIIFLLKKLGFLFIRSNQIFKSVMEIAESTSASIIFSRYLQPAVYSDRRLPLIIDLDDDPEEVINEKIRNSDSWFFKLKLIFIRIVNSPYRNHILKQADLVFVTKKEKTIFNRQVLLQNLPFQILNNSQTQLNPNPYRRNDFEILFIGKLSYGPNSDGLVWFIKNVWPSLVATNDPWLLTIISSVVPKDKILIDLISQNTAVNLFINVEDLTFFYHRASVVIAPIFFGGGTSIKVVEAIFYKKPVVATPFASRGYERFLTLDLIKVANSPKEFAQAIRYFQNVYSKKDFLHIMNHSHNLILHDFNLWKNTLMYETCSLLPTLKHD